MGKRDRRAWVAVLVLSMGVAFAPSVQAAGPAGKKAAAAAKDADLAEATRLVGEVDRLRKAAKYDDAISLAERALAIREDVLGPDHPDVATCLFLLATLSDEKGNYTRAEQLHLRALSIRERALGGEHLDVTKSLNNLALVYSHRGEYARAEAIHQRALAIREKTLGPDHPLVASSHNNLANLQLKKGEYASAIESYRRTLAIREKTLGPDHPDVAISLHNLAALQTGPCGDAPQALEAVRCPGIVAVKRHQHRYHGHTRQDAGENQRYFPRIGRERRLFQGAI